MVAWPDIYNEMAHDVGFVEGPGNTNPWGPEQGISNAAYCCSFGCIVPYHHGYQWRWACTYGVKGCAYVPYHQNGAAASGRVVFDHASQGHPADLQPSDQVTFDWNNNGVPDHIETVIQVYADGTFDTIGANTGSPEGVHRVRRDRRYLLARIRMDYDGVPSQINPSTPAAPTPSQPAQPSGPRVLQQGMKGQDVADWQNQLNRLGYGLAVDGDFGPATNGATRDFQSKHGCTVDGQVGPQTRAAMQNALANPAPAPAPVPAPQPAPSTGPPFPGRILRVTSPLMSGEDVRAWQQKMHDRGWNIGVDRVYGNQSAGICTQFQREKGLVADGQVGPATWNATFNSPVT